MRIVNVKVKGLSSDDQEKESEVIYAKTKVSLKNFRALSQAKRSNKINAYSEKKGTIEIPLNEIEKRSDISLYVPYVISNQIIKAKERGAEILEVSLKQ